MKKILVISLLFTAIIGFANPPLWVAGNTTPITVSGGGDTAITINRILLVEFVTYNAEDSTATVTFNQFRNRNQWAAHNQIRTDVPVTAPPVKIPAGQPVTLTYILQQARQYFIGLGYSVNIQ